MILTPLDLLLSIASSESALREERSRIMATLGALREGLFHLLRPDADVTKGRALFCNAASDFFCQVQVATPALQSQLIPLENDVEAVLTRVKSGTVNQELAPRLLKALELLLESGASKQAGSVPSAKR